MKNTLNHEHPGKKKHRGLKAIGAFTLLVALWYTVSIAYHYATTTPDQRVLEAINAKSIEYYRTHEDERINQAKDALQKESLEHAKQEVSGFVQGASADEVKDQAILSAPATAEPSAVTQSNDYPKDKLEPKDLWYVFAKAWKDGGKVYYSGGFDTAKLAYADHVSRDGGGGKLALDIGTANESRILRAPDYRGAAVEWVVETGSMGDQQVGNYIRLTGRNIDGKPQWLIGHVFDYNVQSGAIVSTGQAIGKSGGCSGMADQGASTGCHTHLEFYEDDVITMYLEYGKAYTDTDAPAPVAGTEELLWRGKVTTYYAPTENDKSYGINGNYADAKAMNCGDHCGHTASGYRLTQDDAFKIVACPPDLFAQRATLRIEGMPNTVKCEDVGGAIKGHRIDLFVGVGDDAWVGRYSGDNLAVYQIH